MGSSIHVTLEDQNGVTIASFDNPPVGISGAAADDVTDALLAAAGGRPPRVLIDFTGVEFFSSSFIETLFRVWNRTKSHDGGRFALCSLHPYCREILDVTNLTTVWKVFPDRQTALQELDESGDEAWTMSQ